MQGVLCVCLHRWCCTAVRNGSVGCGVCAAVIVRGFEKKEDDITISEAVPVRKFIDIVETEVRGIILGLELALKNGLSAVGTRQVVILCDCMVAVDYVTKHTESAIRSYVSNQEDQNITGTATTVEGPRPGGMGSGTHWIFGKRVG